MKKIINIMESETSFFPGLVTMEFGMGDDVLALKVKKTQRAHF